MHATDQTFQILLSQLLEKVEDRCPECGSEQYVWQQKNPLLQAQIETLKATGPDHDTDYDQNIAMLSTLSVGPTLQDNFQAYRYLRTPEDPVKRDSPRRAFMMVLWGAIGLLVGAGVVLARRRPS